GRIQPSYNGLNQRALMMRLRSLMADHGLTPGSIVSHSTNSYPLVVMPWVDALLDGEWAEIKDATKLDWVDHYPIPRLRAMSVSENWGTQISWMSLFHVSDKAQQHRLFRGFFDYQRLYDTWTGQDHRYPSDAILEWGLNDPRLEYVPFWRNREITCGDEDVLVSYWKLPGRVLVLAFNYDGKQAKDPVLRVDFKALGLGGEAARATVRELRGVTGQDGWIDKKTPDPTPTLDAAGQTVTVTGLDPHTGRYFGIRADEPTVVERFLHSFRPLAGRLGIDAAGQGKVVEALLDYGMVAAGTKYLPAAEVRHVTCPDKEIELALWRLPDRVLIAVFNRGEKGAKDAVLSVDLEKLGLEPELPWQEFLRVRDFGRAPRSTLDFYGGKLTVPKLGSGQGRLIGVRRY
ncbi:MAG TPA: hypothetical protein VMZ50_01020, partial [Phycisphaerae bacterium]|nr:hypothetical protein [Phycisphaerae bacterium]